MKRLYKSRKNCVIDGVCGGIGEYFDVDPVVVRIVAVFFLFVGGSALIAYIVGMIIIPKAPIEAGESEETAEVSNAPFAEKSEGLGKSGGLIFAGGDEGITIITDTMGVAGTITRSDGLAGREVYALALYGDTLLAGHGNGKATLYDRMQKKGLPITAERADKKLTNS